MEDGRTGAAAGMRACSSQRWHVHIMRSNSAPAAAAGCPLQCAAHLGAAHRWTGLEAEPAAAHQPTCPLHSLAKQVSAINHAALPYLWAAHRWTGCPPGALAARWAAGRSTGWRPAERCGLHSQEKTNAVLIRGPLRSWSTGLLSLGRRAAWIATLLEDCTSRSHTQQRQRTSQQDGGDCRAVQQVQQLISICSNACRWIEEGTAGKVSECGLVAGGARPSAISPHPPPEPMPKGVICLACLVFLQNAKTQVAAC